MEAQVIEETSNGNGTTESSRCEHNVHSEDSSNSVDSCRFGNDDPTDANSYDAWENDTYYDITESVDDDSKLESGSRIVLDSTVEIWEDVPQTVDIETLEENNNDPNNNMSSIEMNGIETGALRVATTDRPKQREAPAFVALLDRGQSPKPGCSKDSQPVLTTFHQPPNEDEILEKTRHILSLLSKIHRDSIFDALYKNDRVPISELKLWDLMPENERLEYPMIISSRKEQSREPSDVTSEKARAKPVINIAECSNNSSKRGPADDICTVESKKSSSEPDLSILESQPSIPKVSSSSKIAQLPRKPNVNLGAIPKVRDALSKQQLTYIPSIVENPISTELGHTLEPIHAGNSWHSVSGNSTSNQARLTQDGRASCPLAGDKNLSQKLPSTFLVLRAPVLKYPLTRPAVSFESDKSKSMIVGVASSVSPSLPTIEQRERQPQPLQPKTIVCMEMYSKLTHIFPNVDSNYIKNLCPSEWGAGDRDAQLAPLVEHLLEKGDSLPQAPINETNDRTEPDISYNVDDTYENLLGIFPDADPHYLRDFAVTSIGNAEALKNFVDSKLELRDYPTRAEYMARLKITEQQRQYTSGFDVKQFLSIIPNPFEHFMDPKRKCIHQTVAFEFLKSYFKRIRVTTISRMYAQCNNNLSLTADSLERLDADLKSKRMATEIPTEDILLLQEIAFIKHKPEISNYIANARKIEDEEFKSLKAINQLLQCQCCYDSECLPSKCSPCDNGHIFCNSCIIMGTNAKMAEGETRINCFINCGYEFSLSVLQRVLTPTTFSILVKKRQAAEVIEAGLEGLVSCPFCHFASIPPDGAKIFKCLNPECTKESCCLCKELSHVPLRCDEVMKADRARHFVEEKMTEALARKCYKCQRAFFKEEGCNKIRCPCGAQMCYLCDQPIADYSHFRDQSSNDKNRCPLYSDTVRLDAVAVRKVGEQAQAQVLQRNPNVKIDTRNLLPAIPRPMNGPHIDLLNADELPRHAQRVLDLPPL